MTEDRSATAIDFDFDAEGTLRTVEEVARRFGHKELVLVLRRSAGDEHLARLLESPAVAHIVRELAAPAGVLGAQRFGGRISTIALGRPLSPLPRLLRPALIDGSLRALPLALLWALYRSGVTVVIERQGPGWQTRPLARQLTVRAVRAAAIRALDRIHQMEERARLSPALQARLTLPALNLARRAITVARSPGSRSLTAGDLAGAPLLKASAFRAKRILMLNSALAWGGAERQLVNTMVGLSGRGFDVSLACENLGRVPDSEFFAPELCSRSLSFGPLESFAGRGLDTLRPAEVHRLEAGVGALPLPFRDAVWPYIDAILALRPCVLHAWQDQTNILAGVAATIVGVPRVVLSTRNVAPTHFGYYTDHMLPAYRAICRHPSVRLIANSHAGAEDYARWLGAPKSLFTVVHNGFDFPPLLEAGRRSDAGAFGIPDGAPVVGSIFRFFPEKDPVLWIKTAALIAAQRPDVHFIVAGSGPLLGAVREEAKRAGIADRLHLPGAVRDTDRLLGRITAFLMTSRFEGLPNVLIEAQSRGIPVISTDAGGSRETFIHGETGWLVDTRDPQTIADRVLAVLSDETWRQRCAAIAAQAVRKAFGVERMLDQTAALYEPSAGATTPAG